MADLSPQAQAVLTAQTKERCLFEWSAVNDPPCHPSDAGWNGCVQCIDRRGTAAALRAAADQVVPHENDLPSLPPMHEMIEDPIYSLAADAEHEQRQRTRAKLLAIAAELGGET